MEEGTVIAHDLPEGAIGPAEHVVTSEPRQLIDVLGVGAYRLRSVSNTMVEDYTQTLLITSDVIEGAEIEDIAWHERWVVLHEGAELPAYEVLHVDGSRYTYDVAEDEWALNPLGDDMSGWLPLYYPIYSLISDLANGLRAATWLGNTTIDGTPVGHYRLPPLPTTPGTSISSTKEIWVDADGAIRRFWLLITYPEHDHSQETTVELFDIGADIVITAPDLPG